MNQFVNGRRHEFFAKSHHHFKLLTRVNTDGLGAFAHKITQHPLQKIQILVKQRLGWLVEAGYANAFPGFAQISNVLAELLVCGLFTICAKNKTTFGFALVRQCRQSLAQNLTLIEGYFLRNTDVIVLRQKHQQASCDADLGRQASAFGAHGVFHDLHQHGLTFKHLLFNGHNRLGRRIRVCMFGVNAAHQVGNMQKS